MKKIQQLREMLREGLYVNNLWQLASLCKDLAMDDPYPLPFFVMRQVFMEIATSWDERPLPVDEANYVKSKMLKPLEDIIQTIEVGASKDEIFDRLNDFVIAWLIVLP